MKPSRRRALGRLGDPRILLGVAISAVAVWFSLRGLDFAELGRAIGRANLWILVLPSVAAHLLSFWIRALRWRHLTEPVAEIPRRALFRAVSVGFLANNVFPLRLGEVLRAWYLARETGASSAALFGTVIAERLIDVMVMLTLATLLFGLGGAALGGIEVGRVLPALLSGALLPVAGVVVLRVAPDRVISLASSVSGRLLSPAWSERLASGLRRLAEGLSALRGGRHLWWLAFHSATLWLVAAVIPFFLAVLALDLDLGSPARTALAAYTVLIFIGVAVAIPSAPGFFGPYHFACWLALRPFGVGKAEAIALGTLAHAIFWLTATGLGLLVLRFGGTRLQEMEEAAHAPR